MTDWTQPTLVGVLRIYFRSRSRYLWGRWVSDRFIHLLAVGLVIPSSARPMIIGITPGASGNTKPAMPNRIKPLPMTPNSNRQTELRFSLRGGKSSGRTFCEDLGGVLPDFSITLKTLLWNALSDTLAGIISCRHGLCLRMPRKPNNSVLNRQLFFWLNVSSGPEDYHPAIEFSGLCQVWIFRMIVQTPIPQCQCQCQTILCPLKQIIR